VIVAPHDCYGGTYRSLTTLAAKGQFELVLVDQTDEEALALAMCKNPRMIWVETPSNPLLRITDIDAVVRAAAKSDTLVVVDNTFLSPVFQRPIDLGADIVVHSTTKYLNGHSDVVGGAAIAATEELHEQLVWWANCLGLTGAPFDSFLTLRGVRTLHARMRAHVENVEAVAALLVRHPAVARVYYPGLKDHPWPRAREAPTVRFWRDAQLRSAACGFGKEHRRRRSVPPRPALLLARRVPRWCREPRGAPRDDDARRDG
jgi:cystathionine gamma-synthase